MDFFKSVFADEPNLKDQRSELESSAKSTQKGEEDEDPEPNSSSDQPHLSASPNSSGNDGSGGAGGGWSFGGFLKTLSVKSESVLETYSRDLKEFGSGLKTETVAFREAASRAVKELPASIDVAQGSLETVGHAIDELGTSVWKSTAEIISHGKDTDFESDSSENNNPNYTNQSVNSKQYSRFDARVRAIQSDLSTYCEEPEDLYDYNKWKIGFVLEEKGEEVEKLIEENEAMESVYKRVVPSEVNHDIFWCRYFYKVHKLKQAENVRANLVKRAISKEDEEDLSWDVDEDDKEETDVVFSKGLSFEIKEAGNTDSVQHMGEKEHSVEKRTLGNEDSSQVVGDEKVDSLENRELASRNSPQILESSGDELKGRSADEKREKGSNEDNGDKGMVLQLRSEDVSEEKVQSQGEKVQSQGAAGMNDESNEKRSLEGRDDPGESAKDDDLSIRLKQASLPKEEDLEWDEIEDLGSDDEKKTTHDWSPNRTDLRKRLSVAEEEEDLSWDIED
ncbi:uncharacterized protein LOC131155196 [Malania oleifera]|uniref:uncharacterized protein LOC131155196 n=1 Tax=Malania oleifera TaxID=397392 RepID=UPI0025ADC606|nr:uncharacterized protein LOC131155196 [Malania oleifera]